MAVRGALLAACLLLTCLSSGWCCTQVSASVRMFSDADYKYNCHLSLARIKNDLKATTVNFIITKFWIDENGDNTPDYFCVRLGRHPCVKPRQNDTDEYVKHFAGCLKTADELGFTKVQITPHLDDGNATARWRNLLFLDPLQTYDGMTYQEFHINPLLTAIKMANMKAQIYFSLQGEMNYGVLTFPDKWQDLGEGVRENLPPGSKIGLNNNYNDACGADWNMNNCGAINGAAVGAMYDSLDYVGISAYHGIPVGFTAGQLVASAQGFSNMLMQASGYSLTQFLQGGEDKEIHYSEFGIGGSSCNPQGQVNGGCLTNDPGTIAQYPYWGMGSSYRKEQDPWGDYPQNKAFAQYFYTQAVQFGQNDGAAGWPVKQIYIWAYGSYDVVAVHPMSSTGYGSWNIPEVVDIIATHNEECVVG